MENTLLKKLRVAPGGRLRIWNAPPDLAAILGPIPAGVQVAESGSGPADAVLLFAAGSAELRQALSAAQAHFRPGTVIWAAYPKKSSGRQTDLNLMQAWQPGLLQGLEPCASVSIDAVWTGIRLRPAGQGRPSGRSNSAIAAGDWAQYIDPAARRILALPEVLAAAFAGEPAAEAAFKTLAYSHQKEYLLWVLSAKQEKTRAARIEKTVTLLLAGKKNPADN